MRDVCSQIKQVDIEALRMVKEEHTILGSPSVPALAVPGQVVLRFIRNLITNDLFS
jgi:hypothetical protein